MSLPCLYCRSTTVKKTSEHALQRGFGANLTLTDDVCDECNTRTFSKLDGALVDFARNFVYWRHPDVTTQRTILQMGHTLWLDPASGVWINVRVAKDGKPIVLPQVVFVTPERVHIRFDATTDSDWMGRIGEFKAELAVPESLSLSRLVRTRADPSQPEVQPALIRSRRFCYLVRASSESEADALEARVRTGGLLSSLKVNAAHEKKSAVGVEIHNSNSFDLLPIHRALAKSALNLACAVYGPGIARESRFDPIRTFALSGGSFPDPFVRDLWGQAAAAEDLEASKPFVRAGNHTVVLLPGLFPLALFVLYQRPFAAVRLVENPNHGDLPESSVVLFNYSDRSHSVQTLRDFVSARRAVS